MKFPPSQSSYKKNENLDATASQESSSLSGCWVGSLTTSAAQSPGSEGARCKPEDGREESESEGGLELLAVVGSRIVPWVEVPARAKRAVRIDPIRGKDVLFDLPAAAVWQPVNKKTEGNNPQNEHDKVKWPKREGPSHWQEKEDGEEQSETSDDFGVDHAFSSIGLSAFTHTASVIRSVEGTYGEALASSALRSSWPMRPATMAAEISSSTRSARAAIRATFGIVNVLWWWL
jgi:hypothetical protein